MPIDLKMNNCKISRMNLGFINMASKNMAAYELSNQNETWIEISKYKLDKFTRGKLYTTSHSLKYMWKNINETLNLKKKAEISKILFLKDIITIYSKVMQIIEDAEEVSHDLEMHMLKFYIYRYINETLGLQSFSDELETGLSTKDLFDFYKRYNNDGDENTTVSIDPTETSQLRTVLAETRCSLAAPQEVFNWKLSFDVGFNYRLNKNKKATMPADGLDKSKLPVFYPNNDLLTISELNNV